MNPAGISGRARSVCSVAYITELHTYAPALSESAAGIPRRSSVRNIARNGSRRKSGFPPAAAPRRPGGAAIAFASGGALGKIVGALLQRNRGTPARLSQAEHCSWTKSPNRRRDRAHCTRRADRQLYYL